MSVIHVDHPLVQHKLSILRDKETNVREFRSLAMELTMLMAFEAMRDLELEEAVVETPVATAKVKRLAGKKLALIGILRAGLVMVDGILSLVPNARVGHIGLYRDPNTLLPVQYYSKLPSDVAERDIFLLDPMLATGGTAAAAVQVLKDEGAKRIRLLCILAATATSCLALATPATGSTELAEVIRAGAANVVTFSRTDHRYS